MPAEQELKELADRSKWMADPEQLEGLHVRELVSFWRDSGGYLDENYARKIRMKPLDEHYNEVVTNGYWFQIGPHRHKQRAVILQILELLDKHHPTPSVAKVYNAQTDTDGQWGESYAVLSKITLAEHLITVCEMGVSHLVATNQAHRIPNAIIALLGHDLGKLPLTQSPAFKGQYGTGDHPVTGARLISNLKHFDELPEEYRREILHAVLHHHNANPQEGSLHELVQTADRSARHAEFKTKNKVHTAPDWVNSSPIMTRSILAYTNIIPQNVVDDPELRFAERQINPLALFSTGVMGDMNNMFYAAEKGEGAHEPEPQTPPTATPPPLFFGLPTYAEDKPQFSAASEPQAVGDLLNLLPVTPPHQPEEPEEHLGIDDPCWERVHNWIQKGLGEGDTVDAKTIQKKFRVKLYRAEAIFEALIDNGILEVPQETLGEEKPTEETLEAQDALLDHRSVEEKPEIQPTEPQMLPEEPEISADYTFAVPMNQALPAEMYALLEEEPEPSRGGDDRYLADISSWFRPDQYLLALEERIDRAWRWNKTKGGFGDRELAEVTESGTDGTFYWGVTTKHHTWLNIMALRQLAAEQLYPHSQQGAISLFESKAAGGDQDFQDMVLKAIIKYFQKIEVIDTGLLPMDSPYYSLNCEVVLLGGTKQGKRRMVPFHWHHFYEKWEQVAKIREKYPFVNRIKDVHPIVEINSLPELQGQ